MANWLDERAKAAAQRQVATGGAGLSRREVLKRGAVVAGAAWTAPMLLTATPAWAGASICDANNPDYTTCPGGVTFKCCPSGQVCLLNDKGALVCDVPLGGICSNNGNGQCNGGFSRCNHLNTSQCGGPGAICDFNNNAVCIATSPCSGPVGGTKRCGGEGAPCGSDSDCATGSTGGLPDLTCQNFVGLVGTCAV